MAWNCRLITRLPQGFDDEDILFIRQLGIEHTYYSLPVEDHTYERIKAIVARIRDGGLNIDYLQSNRFTFNPYISLGIGNRQSEIEAYREYIEMCAELGIHKFEHNTQPYFVYSNNIASLNRGAISRHVDIDGITNSEKPPFTKPAWKNPDMIERFKLLEKMFYESKERGYSKEALWDNFAYFTEQIMPVAEKCGSVISLHPSDPPTQTPIGGVPQLISSYSDYMKAIQIADSRALGITFCCGCWLEGGSEFGDLLHDMEELLKEDRIVAIHIRNITAPMPSFDETFIDNGMFDYYPVFKLLARYRSNAYVNPDHHPIMVDGEKRRAPQSYAFGFMRAYAMRAAAEENS